MSSKKEKSTPPDVEVVAGNGLLHRRALLGRGIVFAGAMTTGAAGALTAAAAVTLPRRARPSDRRNSRPPGPGNKARYQRTKATKAEAEKAEPKNEKGPRPGSLAV
jgi:hypothetical protein